MEVYGKTVTGLGPLRPREDETMVHVAGGYSAAAAVPELLCYDIL